jgi:stage II sporulation protein D
MRAPAKSIVAGLFLAAVSVQAWTQPAPHSGATLRIGLWTLWHDKGVTISPAGEGTATVRLCETCVAIPITTRFQIRAANAHLTLSTSREADAVLLSGPVTLAAHGETLTLSNPIHITARAGELIFAVTLPVETYVERVVASESGPADSLESLKALAIVVRSFALHQHHGHADYDLCDSTHCQLLRWSGGNDRQAISHAATLSTAGETVWFHGRRAQAWFHQDCGGRTASPQEVWPGKLTANKPMPWLVSRIDPYCTAKGGREWFSALTLPDLTTALSAAGLGRPGWNSITVARRGESGRVATLLLTSDQTSYSTQISAEDFRLAVGRALGWGRILSTWFEVSRQGDSFQFHGRGSGHGVGLCQVGAAAMSAQGRDATQILAQYFPGAIAADETTGHAWQTFPGHGFVLETLTPSDASYLPQITKALAEAQSRSGLRFAGLITLRAFPTTPAFRDATLAPGWVAAFTEGDWIATQPLATLATRKLLAPTLRHEFLHAFVESRAYSSTPLWLREGLVEALDSEARQSGPTPTIRLDQVDHALAHAASESESEAAHQAAGWYAERLLTRFGRAQVLAWLHNGLPPHAVDALD